MGVTMVKKARKEHTCSLCWQRINKGMPYERVDVGPMDSSENDGFHSYSVHSHCHEAIKKLDSFHGPFSSGYPLWLIDEEDEFRHDMWNYICHGWKPEEKEK